MKGEITMRANVNDLKATINWLERMGAMPSYQRDLIEDAVFSLKSGNDYRAERSLKTMAQNYRNDGNRHAADAIERLL
jgi:hypothetical protein